MNFHWSLSASHFTSRCRRTVRPHLVTLHITHYALHCYTLHKVTLNDYPGLALCSPGCAACLRFAHGGEVRVQSKTLLHLPPKCPSTCPPCLCHSHWMGPGCAACLCFAHGGEARVQSKTKAHLCPEFASQVPIHLPLLMPPSLDVSGKLQSKTKAHLSPAFDSQVPIHLPLPAYATLVGWV